MKIKYVVEYIADIELYCDQQSPHPDGVLSMEDDPIGRVLSVEALSPILKNTTMKEIKEYLDGYMENC